MEIPNWSHPHIWVNERKCYKQFLIIFGLDGEENMWHHYVSFRIQSQNKSATQAIKENDIVIIYDEKVPHHLWRLGRVVDIIPSRDSNIRAAKIKVGKTGATINRPIQ